MVRRQRRPRGQSEKGRDDAAPGDGERTPAATPEAPFVLTRGDGYDRRGEKYTAQDGDDLQAS